MPNILVYIPEPVLAELDARVKERKERRKVHKPTQAELAKAVKIAKAKGVHEANSFLRGTVPPRIPSRVGLILEMIQQALKK